MSMRLKNLTKVYVYAPFKSKELGQISTKWKYKGEAYLNAQQDVNELDRTSSGEVDYEIIKFRTDKKQDINKGDGISFTNTKVINNDNEVIERPEYIVKSSPKIGNTTIYNCATYHGE